jgi:hypothetical protein
MFGIGKKSKAKKPDDEVPSPKPAVGNQAIDGAAHGAYGRETVRTSERTNLFETTTPALQPPVLVAGPPEIQPPAQADFVIVFGVGAEGEVSRGAALSVVACDSFVTLGDGLATAGSGGTISESYTAILPAAFEAKASGKTIRMSVLARATAMPLSFHLAYSTNEVGNSGWEKFEAGPDFSEHSFEWAVPPMKEGRGDFAGVQPPLAGEGTIDVAWLALTIK